MRRYSLYVHLLYNLVIIVLTVTCIIPSDSPEDALSISLGAPSDTVAPFGTILLLFSHPLTDSSMVRFHFAPPFYSYTVLTNGEGDTVTITLSEPLTGATRYVIRVDTTVESTLGTVLTPNDDSVVLYTYGTEREPNNHTTTEDFLDNRLYGSISTTNDTDCYRIEDQTVTSIYLISQGSQTSFGICDADNDSIQIHDYRQNDTLTVSTSAAFPLNVTVYPWQKSVGGYYEIGVIKTE